APQRITHFARLRECDELVQGFADAVEPAREAGRLGPLLFQLPPNFAADPERLRQFLQAPALHGRNAPAVAFEFRHPSWFGEETLDVLREHGAALCVAESDELATPDVRTAGFRCYRLRRSGGYTEAELDSFAARFAELAREDEVFVFHKHEDEPTGVLNAVAVQRRAAELAAGAAARAGARTSTKTAAGAEAAGPVAGRGRRAGGARR
ncbi:MAG TPA: DUF72 domain-containing protein, partial [Acidobacteriaceae bacterium]|nr:DUF72 domain-containing protein [Acidobacteriaceae bacterium]